MPSSLFSHDTASIEALRRASGDPAHRNQRFTARNFLLDENVSADRAASYHRSVPDLNPLDFPNWRSLHRSYLKDKVHRGQGEAYRTGASFDPNDIQCPETFGDPAGFSGVGSADEQLRLVRCEKATDIAGVIAAGSGDQAMIERQILDLARRVAPHGKHDSAAARELDVLFADWHRGQDRRPAFVTFLAHVSGLFGSTPAGDVAGWADKLCDRLGLTHFEPGDDFLVFDYSVGELPLVAGRSEEHPLVVPSVLDHALSYAFCPAPSTSDHGFAVDLTERGQLTPELVHPGLRLAAIHLFRVGTVTRPVPLDHDNARRAHLASLRAQAGWADYARETDAI
jgi:hypothetical protein